MDSKTKVYKDPSSNKLVESEVINGKCKLQWKVDWAMRWMSFDVDYEMCGKDLTESVDLGSKMLFSTYSYIPDSFEIQSCTALSSGQSLT